MRTLLAALSVLAFAGCTPPPEVHAPGSAPSPAPGDQADTCGAKALAHLIGKPLTDSAVPPASPAVRHIRPGDAVTEDFRIDRLNIYVTRADVIETIICG